MLDLSALTSCKQLTSAHAKQAASSPAHLRLLAERFTVIARPGEGCPRILMVLAHLADQEWLEGPLRVEIAGDQTATTITVMCDVGGLRERVLPVLRFEVPFDEFSRAVELNPTRVLPLRITDDEGKMVLTPLLAREVRSDVDAAPVFEVDDTSLADSLRKTAPPPALEPNIHEMPTRRNLAQLADKGD